MSEIQPNLFWSSGNNSLIIGNSGSYTNPIDASLVLSAGQIASSGIYPLKISLNQGNFFVLTKDGKVAINTPSFPVYESSPNFHMVGRCAVFEGTCGAGGVALTLYNNPDVVPQIGSIAGSLNLSARNNNRNVVNFAQVQSKILNPLKGKTRGQFVVNIEASGVSKSVLQLDDSINQIGINDVSGASYTSVLGSGNILSYVNNSKVIGDGNLANRSNNLYLLGSDNSIDLIKNSVAYVLGYDVGESPLMSVPSGFEWGPINDLSAGDIVKIENNALYNGYYIVNAGQWTKIDDTVAVGYIGTSNILIGSENQLSGNNVIAIGNDSIASGNNIFMFGSYNSIQTDKLTGILSTNSNDIDNSFVVGSYNVIAASGLIVFGNHNKTSGVSAIVLNGSNNTLTEGSIESVLIGDDNSINSIFGVVLGSENTGSINLGSILGFNNTVSLSNGSIVGANNSVSGVQNNIFGHNTAINGAYVTSVGNNSQLQGTNDLSFGYNQIISGHSGIYIGNKKSVTGNNQITIGSNILASGSYSILSGHNINAKDITKVNVYGSNNNLASGNYLDSNVIGQNNIVSSGMRNINMLGTNNKLYNIYDLTIQPVESIYDSEYGVRLDLQNIDLFRVGDVVSVKDLQQTYIIDNKIPPAPGDANTQQFTLEFNNPIPSSLVNQTLFIKSLTLQDEIIYNQSIPNNIIGNNNTVLGMSGLIMGNLNNISGTRVVNIASSSSIKGGDIINIGSKLICSSGNNIISVGGNFQGIVDSSTNLGFNNTNQYQSSSILGSDNFVINGDIFGSGNRVYDRNTNIIGNTNLVLGYGKYFSEPKNIPFSSGLYDSSLNAIVLSSNAFRFYPTNGEVTKSQKLIVQLAHSGNPLPAFSGYMTASRGDILYFGEKGPEYGDALNRKEDTFNPVPLDKFVKNLFPSSAIPDDIQAFIYPVTDERKIILGDNNTAIKGYRLNILGNNNTFGTYVNRNEFEVGLTSSYSGLIIGDSNLVSRAWHTVKDVGLTWSYPVESIFQGAIGLNITNQDPNAIYFGHEDHGFKLFDLGGRQDREITEIVDPLTIPPTTKQVKKEIVGKNTFSKGLIFNHKYQSDVVFGVMSSTETNEPVITIIPSSENRIGINTSLPQATLDVSGTIYSTTLKTTNATITNLSIPNNSASGYFLASKNSNGDAEWVSGLKVDFQGLPGTLMYWSGVSLTDGKIQPMSQIIKSNKDNSVVTFNQIIYNPSGCVIARSGLIFDQYMWCDKYSIMSLDGLRRNILADVLPEIEDNESVNPHGLEYTKKLLDLAKSENRVPEEYYVPYSANVLYFIPELITNKYMSDGAITVESPYKAVLETAGYNREGIFAIGRRRNTMPSPFNDNIEDTEAAGSFAAEALPNGMVAPQHILSTIPKKNNSNKKVHYRFNRIEMSYYTEALANWKSVINTDLARYMRPMETEGDQKGWWDERGKPDDANVQSGSDTDLARAVPTAFNMGLQETDFIIYGTGSKYKTSDTFDVPKFVLGSESEFQIWRKDPTLVPIDLPCVTRVPAFYFNASINSFMLHTMKPSWIPVPIPGDECKPCNPKESGVWFADLTVRGWIGTSGIRIGTGLTRQVQVDPEDGTKVRQMVDEKGNPLFRSTRGMYLRSDAYGFGVWDEGPDGISVSSSDVIQVPASSEKTLVEGSLDPLIDIANFPVETNDILTSARLIRDSLIVKADAESISNSFRIRGITRNTLLFAQNPGPNTYYRSGKTNKFNEPPYQSDNNAQNESTIDGTENVFYYGYSNALAGILLYNNSLQKTEVHIEGDATKRIKVGDVVRIAIYYEPDNFVEGQPYPQKIIKVNVIGVNPIWLLGQKTLTGKTLNTQIVLGEKLDIPQTVYSLDSSDQLRQVAIMSEKIGGYLTFNYPGTTPELVLSNRDGIPNLFNTSGKKIDFAVYGNFSITRPDPSLFIDSTNRSVNINTAKSQVYGSYKKSLTFNSSLLSDYKADINSPIYYDYGWQEKYLLGKVEETSSLLRLTGNALSSMIDVKVGDIIEIIYDNTQKIIGQVINKTVPTPAQPGPVDWDFRVSLTAVNPGLVDDRIGNIQRIKDNKGNETEGIVNTNIKIKVIKRQLVLSTIDSESATSITKAEGDIPLNPALSVKGLTYTDGLMLSDKDALGHVTLPHNSILYNRHGMVFGSNLRFFTYDDLLVDNKKNQHLLYNTDIPAVIASGVVSEKIDGNVPVFADTTFKGATKIEQLYIDTLNSFDTIDGGLVVFGGTCNGPDLRCQ